MNLSKINGNPGVKKDVFLPSEETKSVSSENREGKLENSSGIFRKISQLFTSPDSQLRKSDIDRKRQFEPQEPVPADLTKYQRSDQNGTFPNPNQLFDQHILEDQSVGSSPEGDDTPSINFSFRNPRNQLSLDDNFPLREPLLSQAQRDVTQRDVIKENEKYVQQEIPNQHGSYVPPEMKNGSSMK